MCRPQSTKPATISRPPWPESHNQPSQFPGPIQSIYRLVGAEARPAVRDHVERSQRPLGRGQELYADRGGTNQDDPEAGHDPGRGSRCASQLARSHSSTRESSWAVSPYCGMPPLPATSGSGGISIRSCRRRRWQPAPGLPRTARRMTRRASGAGRHGTTRARATARSTTSPGQRVAASHRVEFLRRHAVRPRGRAAGRRRHDVRGHALSQRGITVGPDPGRGPIKWSFTNPASIAIWQSVLRRGLARLGVRGPAPRHQAQERLSHRHRRQGLGTIRVLAADRTARRRYLHRLHGRHRSQAVGHRRYACTDGMEMRRHAGPGEDWGTFIAWDPVKGRIASSIPAQFMVMSGALTCSAFRPSCSGRCAESSPSWR